MWTDLFNAALGTKQSEFGSPSQPTSSGNTGIVPDGDFLDWISRGADVYRDIKGADSIIPPNSPSGTTPGTAKTTLANAKWLPYAIGGAVLLIVAVFFFRR